MSQPLAIALVAGTAIVIAVFSLSRSDARILSSIPEWSSPIGHFLLYGLLGYACIGALQALGLATPNSVFGGVALATGFGAGMELAQRFRPGRCARGVDVLIDAAGAAVGGGVFIALAATAAAAPGG